MVKLSAKYLIQRNKCNKYFLTRKKNDTDKQFLKRITHLPLQNNFIEQILRIDDCKNVKVLYLQQNLLKNIENMENFPNLTHLYLQRNFIVRIENLNCLKKLKKIYLGRNEIQVLEGMGDLHEIKEIHLENQDLSIGDTMYFEPLTILNLGTTLQVLNISRNYLTSIEGLKNLLSLKNLNASFNYLSDINDLTMTISKWPFLEELNLEGNQVTYNKSYKDLIILASKSLEILDREPIHPNTRIYVERLTEQKKIYYLKQKNKLEENKEKRKTLTFANDVNQNEKCFDFIDFFPPQQEVYLYPAWKLRKNVNSGNPKKSLPRPFWRKSGLQ